jgi:hypothetical protein
VRQTQGLPQLAVLDRADKLGTGEAKLNFTPALSGLLRAYLNTFGNTAKRPHGPGQSPGKGEKRPTDWLRLAPTDSVLLAALSKSIGQGVPACCEVAEAAWLIAGYTMSPERLHLFNPIAGDSHSISMAEYHQLYPHIQNLCLFEGDLSWLDAQ